MFDSLVVIVKATQTLQQLLDFCIQNLLLVYKWNGEEFIVI